MKLHFVGLPHHSNWLQSYLNYACFLQCSASCMFTSPGSTHACSKSASLHTLTSEPRQDKKRQDKTRARISAPHNLAEHFVHPYTIKFNCLTKVQDGGDWTLLLIKPKKRYRRSIKITYLFFSRFLRNLKQPFQLCLSIVGPSMCSPHLALKSGLEEGGVGWWWREKANCDRQEMEGWVSAPTKSRRVKPDPGSGGEGQGRGMSFITGWRWLRNSRSSSYATVGSSPVFKTNL